MTRRTAKLKQSTAPGTVGAFDPAGYLAGLNNGPRWPEENPAYRDGSPAFQASFRDGARFDIGFQRSKHHDLHKQWNDADEDVLRAEANRRVNLRKLDALQSLWPHLWEGHRPEHGKPFLARRAEDLFAGRGDFQPHVRAMARDILASGALGTNEPPKAKTVEGWTNGIKLSELFSDLRSEYADKVEILKPLLVQAAAARAEINAEINEAAAARAKINAKLKEADAAREEINEDDEDSILPIDHDYLAQSVADFIDNPDEDEDEDDDYYDPDEDDDDLEAVRASGILADEPDTLAAISRWIAPYTIEELTT